MLRLRGGDKNGNMHQFDVTQIDGPVGDYIAVAIHSDHATHIDPATIQLADDKCECPFCGKSWKPFKVEMNKEAKL